MKIYLGRLYGPENETSDVRGKRPLKDTQRDLRPVSFLGPPDLLSYPRTKGQTKEKDIEAYYRERRRETKKMGV